jgi:hypothetical protein
MVDPLFEGMEHVPVLKSLGMPPYGNCFGSKSSYASRHQNEIFCFNARVVIDGAIVWQGDLNITQSKTALDSVAEYFGKDVYVLSEGAAWDNQRIDYSKPLYVARMGGGPISEPAP